MVVLLLLLISLVSAQQQLLLGCFRSAGSLSSHGTNTFQSQGACLTTCLRQGHPIAAVKNTECFCGDAPPPLAEQVPDTECDAPCVGYAREMCGGDNSWTVLSSKPDGSIIMSGTMTAPPHTPTPTTLLGGIIVDGDASVSIIGVPSSTAVASSVPIATSRAVPKASPSPSQSPSPSRAAASASASATHASAATRRKLSGLLIAAAAAAAIALVM